MKPVFKLTKEEKYIEKHLDDYVPVSKAVRYKIGRDMDEIRKKRSITMRVNDPDLKKIRQKAKAAGLPYQTYLNSLIHKDAENRLMEVPEEYGKKKRKR